MTKKNKVWGVLLAVVLVVSIALLGACAAEEEEVTEGVVVTTIEELEALPLDQVELVVEEGMMRESPGQSKILRLIHRDKIVRRRNKDAEQDKEKEEDE